MLLEGQLVALVVVGVLPELAHERVISACVLLALPEFAVDAFEDGARHLQFVVLHDVRIPITHRLHALTMPDNPELLEDVNRLLKLLLVQRLPCQCLIQLSECLPRRSRDHVVTLIPVKVQLFRVYFWLEL